jgi:tetratricopeptide (TPR) repeat protein
MRYPLATLLILATFVAGLAPPAAGGQRRARLIAETNAYITRSFMAPADSASYYCARAEEILLRLQPEYGGDPDILVRLGLVNGRLAESCPKREKVERVQRVDRYCRAAIARDSTLADAYLLLGALNYRLSSLSWVERMLARAFIGELPDASLEGAERHLRRSIELQGACPLSMYALGRTLGAQRRLAEAIDCLRACLELPPATRLDEWYQDKAGAHLAELERQWAAVEEPWHALEDF